MAVSLVKAEEAGKISNQSGSYDVESVTRVASRVWYAMYRLLVLYKEEEKEKSYYSSQFTLPLISLKDLINTVEKDNSLANDSAIIKFCRLIAENDELYKELRILNNLAESFANKEFHFQLEKIVTDFKLKNLKNKIACLLLLKEESDFTSIQNAYRDEWSFYDLINDKDFKQTYIDKAIDELESEDFRKSIDKYVRLAEQGKEVASKHFWGKGVELQAYYTEDDSSCKILNINCINEDKELRISDILQQERDVNELNIYCNKKQRVHAYQKDKERHYEFKEGTYYGMESTWHVRYEDGDFAVCTIVMNVSSDGITEILEFKVDGKNHELSGRGFQYIQNNNELYIQDLPLYDAVIAYLPKGQEKIWPSYLPPISKNASTQIDVNLQHVEKAKVGSRHGNDDRKNDLSSNVEHIDSVEKVAESRKFISP